KRAAHKTGYGKCGETYGIWESTSSETQQALNSRSGLRLTSSVISDLNMRLQIYLRFTCKLPHIASEGFWIARAPSSLYQHENPKAACEVSYETAYRRARSSRVSKFSLNWSFVLWTYGRCFGAELHRKQVDG